MSKPTSLPTHPALTKQFWFFGKDHKIKTGTPYKVETTHEMGMVSSNYYFNVDDNVMLVEEKNLFSSKEEMLAYIQS